ncbi:hypothetical protein SASPL_122530 [Salvia splendens]|uniref:Uncharacterized protein n=1 Tax=Salvia splendens TaxID=180675 RepID=A0A8X8XNI1_SALSN|nr:hypothetical protein SASPL_122530 [Salvia splendens]
MYGPQLYSCSDWEQPGVLSDYYDPLHERSNSSRYSVGRNAYRPPGEISDYYEPPHARSNSSWNGLSDSHIALAKARTRVGLRQNRTSSRFCM